MTSLPTHIVRLADLPQRKPTHVTLTPDEGARAALAADLGIPGLPALTFEVTLTPQGRTDWTLAGRLLATAEQTCVVTLAPVLTGIDEPVTRRYLAHPPEVETGSEVEMPEDDTAEALPAAVDLYEVAAEALALALPAYPRAPDADLGAGLGAAAFTEPGKAPLTDEDLRPFAGLKALRDKLDGGEN